MVLNERSLEAVIYDMYNPGNLIDDYIKQNGFWVLHEDLVDNRNIDMFRIEIGEVPEIVIYNKKTIDGELTEKTRFSELLPFVEDYLCLVGDCDEIGVETQQVINDYKPLEENVRNFNQLKLMILGRKIEDIIELDEGVVRLVINKRHYDLYPGMFQSFFLSRDPQSPQIEDITIGFGDAQ